MRNKYTRTIFHLTGSVFLTLSLLGLGWSIQSPAAYAGGCGPQKLNIVSPTVQSGFSTPAGPVGVSVTVSGTCLPPNMALSLFVSKDNCSTDSGDTNATPTVDTSGTLAETTFQWPQTTLGNFVVCAQGPISSGFQIASSTSYKVLSATAPSITLSSDSVNSGDTVTVTGKNFVPSGIQLNIRIAIANSDDCGKTVAQTVSTGNNGTFTSTFQAQAVSSPQQFAVFTDDPSFVCLQPGQSADLNPPVFVVKANDTLTINVPPTPTPTSTTQPSISLTATASAQGGNTPNPVRTAKVFGMTRPVALDVAITLVVIATLALISMAVIGIRYSKQRKLSR